MMIISIIFISILLTIGLYYYIYKTINKEIARQKKVKETIQKQKADWISNEFDKINDHLKDIDERTASIRYKVDHLSLLERKRVKSSDWVYDAIDVRVQESEGEISGKVIEMGPSILGLSETKARGMGRRSKDIKDYTGESLLYEVETT